MDETGDHQPHQLRRVGVPRQRIRLGKKISFKIGRRRIDVVNERRFLRRADERGCRSHPVRLEDLRHLSDRQPLGKGDVDDVDLAARDLVDHLEGRHRAIESVLAGLQMAALSADP